MVARAWLAEQNWDFLEDGVLIIDEAQLSYWDHTLWDMELKPIKSSTPYMVILFASYGSASRDLLPGGTSFRVQEGQLVGLARGPNSSVGLLLTEQEMEGVVQKIFPDHRFDGSLIGYVYSLTSGHVGACYDTLLVIERHEVSPHQPTWNMDDNDFQSYRALKTKDRKYTHEDFILGFEMSTFLQQLSDRGVFSRGLPTRDDLKDPATAFATNLRSVLEAPLRFVLVTRAEDQHESKNPLRQCLEKGWLFSEGADEGKVKYRFASRLHELYTEWLLLRSEGA
jgi:hypothetical protein